MCNKQTNKKGKGSNVNKHKKFKRNTENLKKEIKIRGSFPTGSVLVEHSPTPTQNVYA